MSKYIIKVHETYLCDSPQGIQYLFEKERAIKYDTKAMAEHAAKRLVIGYRFKVEPYDTNRIDSIDKFEAAKAKHLKALEEIRDFIFGDENNQPQVTYIPNMMKFENHYKEVKAWIETSTFEADDDN